MDNTLALSVINDSGSYDERVRKFRTMNRGQYRGFIQALVAKIAHSEHVKFGVRHKPAAISAAADEVVTRMTEHMAEWDDAQLASLELSGTPAPVRMTPRAICADIKAQPVSPAYVVFVQHRSRGY